MTGRDSRTPWQLKVLLSVVYAAAAVALAAALPGLLPAPALLKIIATVLALLVIDRFGFAVALGRSKILVDWVEAAIVLGLVLLPWQWLVVVTAATLTILEFARRTKLMQGSFNVAATTACAAIAGVVVKEFGSSLTAPASWLGLLTAALVFSVISAVTLQGAIAFSTEQRLRVVMRCQLPPLLVAGVLSTSLSMLILAAWQWSRPSLLLAPPLLGAAFYIHRHYAQSSTQTDALRRLEVASRTFDGLDESRILVEILNRARVLFCVDSAELVLLPRRGDDHDAPYHRPALLATLDPGQDQLRRLPTDASAARAVCGDPSVRRVDDVLLAPLRTSDGTIGFLRLVAFATAFSEQERQVLATFAATVASTLLNVRAYQDKVYEAQHDTLTGVANRALLEDTVLEALQQRNADGVGCALLLLDLDNFKNINDTLGHLAGDKLLVEVANRLAASIRPGDLVARLGGDEFGILLRDLTEQIEADRLATSMLERLRAPFMLEGLRISMEGSIGAAVHPGDADDVEGLLRCADVAMYRAKRRGHSVVRYDAAGDPQDQARLAVLADLQVALDEDQLVLYYQPKINLRTGLVTGAEALVRWQHPVRGLLTPDDFVPVVEHSSLIGVFTLHLLDRAIADCVAWQDGGLPNCGVAVNVSARNLLHHELPNEVATLLARHRLDPRFLMLEVTETAMMTEAEVCEEVLRGLRSIGVRISVDDFGTGYSSLTFLQRVAVHEVKLDRAFVSHITSSASAATIVRATTDLAHGLGLSVVAEGVETEEQLRQLQGIGCDIAQGYYLGRPAPVAAFRGDAQNRQIPTPRPSDTVVPLLPRRVG
jgi:diguanylate cyclase (GGDEF)-like protein